MISDDMVKDAVAAALTAAAKARVETTRSPFAKS
jgi:hypothetical protein